VTAMSIPAPLPSQQRIRAAAAALLITLAALLLAGSCNDPDRIMNNPDDQLGQHLRDYRDYDERGERR
jgi:hypothetical protein